MLLSAPMWKQTACILCECNCGIEVAPRRRRRAPLRADPRRQGPPGVAGLHLREGAAARPLPERPRRAGASAAAAPARRHLRGDRLGHRHRRGRRPARGGARRPRRRVDLLLRRRRAGEPPRRRATATPPRRRSAAVPLQRPGPGEDRRVLGQRQDARRAMVRADFEHAEVALFVGKNPWQSHSIPHARTTLKEIANDPARVADRHRPAPHRDGRAGRLPPRRCGPGTDAWLLAALAAVIVQEDLVDHAWLAEHAAGRRRGRRPRSAPIADRRVLRRQRRRRGAGPRRRPAHRRRRRAWPSSRTSACR